MNASIMYLIHKKSQLTFDDNSVRMMLTDLNKSYEVLIEMNIS